MNLWLALLLAIDPRASKVDVSGGAAIEARVGSAPVTPGEPSVLSFLSILTPNADLRVTSRRGGIWLLGYSPRVQLRLPNRISLKRPLLLHQLYTGYDVDLTRRWALGVNLGGSVGELDYTGVTTFLGDNAQTPAVDVTQFAIASADVRFAVRMAPRHSIGFGPRGNYRAPISSNDGANGQAGAVPPQLTAEFPIIYTFDAAPRDGLDVTATPGVVDYDSEVTFFSTDGRLGWTRQMRPQLSGRLDAGVFGASVVRGGNTSKVFPVGAGTLNGRLYSRSSHWVDGQLGVGVLGFFDRVTSRVDPRAQLTASITTVIPPRWSAGVTVAGFTAITSEPRVVGMSMTELPETLLRAQTPINYTINRFSSFEFGTVFSVRASHIASDNFAFSQFETWFYVAYRIAAGTARGRGEVGSRSNSSIGTGTSGINAEQNQ